MGRKPSRRKADARCAVAYIRVSTDRERQALGEEAQRVAIGKWAKREGVTLVAEHVEEVSGTASLDKRPVLMAALAEVGIRRAGVFVVAKLDRFSREPITAALAELELGRHGASLVCADGVGDGDAPALEMLRTILLAVSKFEKEMIRARIKAALAVKQSRGEMTGAAPYGFRAVEGPLRTGKDGVERPVQMLERCPEEQATLRKVRALHAKGRSIRGTIEEATARGLLGRTGKPFAVAAMHAMVSAAARA